MAGYTGKVPRDLTDAEKKALSDGTIPKADEVVLSYLNHHKVSAVTQYHIRKHKYSTNVDLFAEQFKDEAEVNA